MKAKARRREGLKISVIVLCLCVFLILHSVPFCLAATEAFARTAITAAEQRVTVCYAAVAEADRAGGNVSALLSTLNEAGMLLSKAHLAFQGGDFDSAYNLAGQSSAMLDGFDGKAVSLRDAAAHEAYLDFMIYVVGSAAGTFAVIFGGFAVWYLLKRRSKQTGVVVG